MAVGEVTVVMAVKALPHAKSRLANALAPHHRAELVLAMLADTVSAASACPDVASVWVITADQRVAQCVDALGAHHVDDPFPVDHPGSLNGALARAALASGTTGPVLALQGDLPCLRPDQLSAAIAAGAPHARSFVADRPGDGTAMLLARRGPLDPRFGGPSAAAHRASGAIELAGDWPGLRLDVDTAEDLVRARALGLGAHSVAVVAEREG